MDLASRDKDCLWEGIEKVEERHFFTYALQCLEVASLKSLGQTCQYIVAQALVLTHAWPASCDGSCCYISDQVYTLLYELVEHTSAGLYRGMQSSSGLPTCAYTLAQEATGPPAYPSASLWSTPLKVTAPGNLLSRLCHCPEPLI